MRHVPETGSTNADLLAEAAAGAPHRSVLFTDHQTAGRGRLDRRWDAPPGANLLVSFLFRDGREGASPVELMRRIALAAVDAVAEVAGVHARLKWPNDVLVDGRKLAGLLAQRNDTATVIGLGLNVRWAPEGGAVLGERHRPADVLAALLRAYDRLDTDVHDRYRRLLATIGQRVRVDLPAGEPLLGRALDAERDGSLVVLDDCGLTHRVDVGDVIHVRPA